MTIDMISVIAMLSIWAVGWIIIPIAIYLWEICDNQDHPYAIRSAMDYVKTFTKVLIILYGVAVLIFCVCHAIYVFFG